MVNWIYFVRVKRVYWFNKWIFFFVFLPGFIFSQTTYSLKDCIDIALSNNPTGKIAQLQVESTKANKEGTWSTVLPSINYSMSRSTQESYFSPQYGFLLPEREFYSGLVSVNLTLFDGGQGWNQLRVASKNIQLIQQSEWNNRVNIVLDVKKSFYQYLKDLQLLEVAKKSLELSRQQMELVEHQYEIEAVARSDLLKQKVQVGNSEVELLNQKVAVKNSFNLLTKVMGIRLDSQFEVVDTLEKSTELKPFATYWNKIKTNNPSLQVKKAQIELAELSIKIARGNLFPSISTSLSYDASGDGIDYLFSNFKENWRFLTRINFSYPLFTGLQRKSQIEKAKIEYKIQQEEYQDLLSGLEVKLDLILRQLENLKAMIPIFEMTKVSSEEDLRLVQERYNLGAATILDVLDAQLSVTRANSSLVQAIYDEKILRAELDALLGKME